MMSNKSCVAERVQALVLPRVRGSNLGLLRTLVCLLITDMANHGEGNYYPLILRCVLSP
jgi:hypothetical protein